MIDIFTVLLPHALMALTVWRLLHRDDLDDDPAIPRERRVHPGTARRAQRPQGGPRA